MRPLLALLPALGLAAVVCAIPSNDSQDLLWGAYRPNLYFGLRPRLPQSLMTGLIWHGTQDFQSFQSKQALSPYYLEHIDSWLGSEARHACEQGDGLAGYTWTEYDVREGGIQVLKDPRNNVQVTTELLKVPGGRHGGSWATRIKGEPLNHGEHTTLRNPFLLKLQ